MHKFYSDTELEYIFLSESLLVKRIPWFESIDYAYSHFSIIHTSLEIAKKQIILTIP